MKQLWVALSASVLLSVVLCGQTPPRVTEDTAIFGPGKLHQVRVSLSKAEWDVMQTSSGRGYSGALGTDIVQPDGRLVHVGGGFGGYFPWVHADLLLNGREVRDVGLRYKGNGSFVNSDAAFPFRVNLKVKTDLFGGKADWNGAETLNFHAGVMDPTLTRETVSYAIYRAAGIPAPRTAYAEITFNVPGLYENAPGGFYTLIENVNKSFLKRALPPGTGLLLKPEQLRGGIQYLGETWASYIPIYRPDRDATPHEQQRLIEFTRLISQTDVAPGGLFREKIRTYLDVDEFLRFIAVTAFIMNRDSYLNGSHNFYLYLDPKDDKFRFIPWDVDKAMPARGNLVNLTNGGFDVLQPTGPGNALLYRLLDDPVVMAEYRAILKELAESVFLDPVLNKMIADADQVVSNRDPSARIFLNNRAAYIQSLVAEWAK
jgi:spore coat protein H